MKLWWISGVWARGLILAVGSLVVMPCLIWLFHERRANWFAQHRVYLWMVIGLVWWTCLNFSALGLAVMVVAIFCRFVTALFPRLVTV